jgi:glycerophosphoryl diester phosphodiesterase
MSTANDTHLDTLDKTIGSGADYQSARQHAPYIRFDDREPFLPLVVGYTIFHESGVSPSFPRQINLPPEAAAAIEYAIWWDWDIGHLYELEHVWVFVDQNGDLVRSEASWHGGYNVMIDKTGQIPMKDKRLAVYSEPGKHAFAPYPEFFSERKPGTLLECGRNAGIGGVHVTPLFKGIIRDRTPLNNRLVHTYLERQSFIPGYDFSKAFDLQESLSVPWDNLRRWIPTRVTWWIEELQRTIPPHERRGLRIAHRGASAHAQENSAASVQKAWELGADMVEMDIRTTADHMPVIAHDPSLKRLYDVDALIADVTLDELRSYTESGPILTFDEMLKLCRELQLGLYLDIKELSWEAALRVFAALDEYDFINHAIFGSFRPDYLAEIKAYRPDAVTSILFNSIHVDPVLLARSIRADYVHPCWESRSETPHELLTPEWLAEVRDAQLGIVCWHEERPSEIAALQALGVDAICSDTPELLVPVGGGPRRKCG